MKEAIISGGATLWARQTIESEIFHSKPAVWFKIWFYLVNRVSHKDTKKYKRGETFLQYEWLSDSTGATLDQIKKCMSWLRKNEMLSTRRSTRGVWINITNYSHFQRLDNYYYDVKAPHEALEKHQRSTREALRYNKNDKNEKNIFSKNAKNKDFQHLKDIILIKYEWQDKAEKACEKLQAENKRSSIFKCFKDNQQKADIALNDCRELGKLNELYFLKVYNELNK